MLLNIGEAAKSGTVIKMTKPLFYKYIDYFREAPKLTGTDKMENKFFWIWLSLAFNSNVSAYSDKVLYEFGGVENVYYATEEMLNEAFPDDARLVKRLADKNLTRTTGTVTECERKNIGILTPNSIYYPTALNSIPAKPMVLYYKGSIPDFRQHLCVSVVGTRKASQYGSNAAYTLSYDLAKNNAIVVSGMADGIDGISHRGALDAMGQTVAVLGSGVDVIYPKNNTSLYNELLVKGLIISEYPPGAAPEGWHFPQRNRIISALSSAVLVVEAAEKSGALITAEYAKKQGKMLYAVPGKVGEHTSTGTNALILAGAKMTTCANDILSDFFSLYPSLTHPSPYPFGVPRVPRIHNVARVVKNNIIAEPTDSSFLDNSAGYMSMEVDPKLEEARRAHANTEQQPEKEKLILKYPDEPLTDEGYTIKSYKLAKPVSSAPKNNNPEDPTSTSTPPQKHTVNKKHTSVKATEPPKAPSIDLNSFTNENERKVVEYLMSHEKATIDEMTSMGLSVQDITFAITMLEIQGTVNTLPGGYCALALN